MNAKWMLSLAAVAMLLQTALGSEAAAHSRDRSLDKTAWRDLAATAASYSLLRYYPEMVPYVKSRMEHESPANVAAKPAQETVTYEVAKGDTLFGIARKFQTSVDVLVAANGLSDPDLLTVGQKLQVPVAQSEVAAWLQNREDAKVIKATLTAYTAGVESTGKTPSHPLYGITASGTRVKEGRTIAVDPKVIPMGSTVYIEGLGLRIAEDTGSAIKGARIDVYMEDLDEALKFGVKKDVTVHILSMPKT